MCGRTDSARDVREAAESLTRACVTPLQKLYEDTANEEIPEDMQELLKRLD